MKVETKNALIGALLNAFALGMYFGWMPYSFTVPIPARLLVLTVVIIDFFGLLINVCCLKESVVQ